MGFRNPTEDELSYINSKIAKKKCEADDVFILADVRMANDFMLTSYNYYLGSSTLQNFAADLARENIPLQINHEPGIPLGTWLPGTVQVSPDAFRGDKTGKQSELVAHLYMPRNLELGGYKTDDLVKAYHAGTLTDVSVGWYKAESLPCSVCGNDIRDWEQCSHVPGRAYNGEKCTFTVEGAHLGECSLVWAGGLPGATLSADIETIKNNKGAITQNLSGTLSFPLTKSHREESDMTMTFDEVKEKFKAELAAEYVLKSDHEQEIAGGYCSRSDYDLLVADLEAARTDLAGMTQKFADANAELEANKVFAPVGEKYASTLVDEYNRLGTALHGEKWDHETKGEYLSKMEPSDRVKFLEGEISLIKEQLTKVHEKPEGGAKRDGPYTHRDNPALYK